MMRGAYGSDATIVSKFLARALLMLACLAGGAPAAHANGAPSEYEVKAAFLLNFLQFIEWPASALPSSDTPLVVGVLGDDPFGSTLEQTFQDESVNGRQVRVRRSDQIEDLKNCHLLFICRSERDRLAQIMADLGDASVVTVGELEDFVRRGGVINFYIEQSKVRFEINVDSAERKDLKISSQLLKRARIIGSGSGRRN